VSSLPAWEALKQLRHERASPNVSSLSRQAWKAPVSLEHDWSDLPPWPWGRNMCADGTSLLEDEEAAAMPRRTTGTATMLNAGRARRAARTMVELDVVGLLDKICVVVFREVIERKL
jgi:hypothetical protein